MGRDPQRLKYLLYLLQKISDLEKKHETLLGRACNWKLRFLHSILRNYFFAFCFTKRSQYFLRVTFIFNFKNESIKESDFKKYKVKPWANETMTLGQSAWVRSLPRTEEGRPAGSRPLVWTPPCPPLPPVQEAPSIPRCLSV